ncbi:MAG: hypothetical protein K2O11_12655 [Oscillospiraceae bacterium]|nr:hypothetical protein [Oscillospiraceae bacterium]
MQRKKLTLRFDLDHPEDKQAWEYLQGLNAVSLNRTMVSIINQAERIGLMKGEFRGIIREELAAALKQLPVQPVQTEPESDDGMDNTIMDFLDSFS